MKVKLKTIMAGPDCNHQPGDVIDVTAKTGKELIAGGHAEKVEGQGRRRAVRKTAATETPETAEDGEASGKEKGLFGKAAAAFTGGAKPTD